MQRNQAAQHEVLVQVLDDQLVMLDVPMMSSIDIEHNIA
jgi:uncharacterized membrane protein affecting hemolysin expression